MLPHGFLFLSLYQHKRPQNSFLRHTLQIIQMARAFQNVIRYWHRSVHQYLLGKRSTCSVASR